MHRGRGTTAPEAPAEDIDRQGRPLDVVGVDNNGALRDYDIGADEWWGVDTEGPEFAGLEKVHAGDTFVNLWWNVARDASLPIVYDIYVRTGSEVHDYGSPDYSTSGLWYRVTGLTNGVPYYFVVKARDGVGNRDGNEVELEATPHTMPSGSYVDARFGSDATGDGSVLSPWRHITYALTQVSGPATIYVLPGVYDTAVDGEGYWEIFPLVMESGVSIVSTDGREATTIDAEGTGRVITAQGLGVLTRLEGFTVTGGVGSNVDGGGIYINNALLEVLSNRVTGNRVEGGGNQSGGGIYVGGSSAVVVEGNEITGNSGIGGGRKYGGGLCVSEALGSRVVGNVISGNSLSSSSYYDAFGAGIYLYNTTAEVRGNTIGENNAGAHAAAVGGGIHVRYGAPVIEGNRIEDNVSTHGGGVYLNSVGPTCRIWNNAVVGNDASSHGDGMLLGSASPDVVNNTISYNAGDGLVVESSSLPKVLSNIISHNTGYGIREQDASSDPVSVRYNDLYGNGTGIYYDEGRTSFVNLGFLESYVAEVSDNIDTDAGFVSPERPGLPPSGHLRVRGRRVRRGGGAGGGFGGPCSAVRLCGCGPQRELGGVRHRGV